MMMISVKVRCVQCKATREIKAEAANQPQWPVGYFGPEER